MARKRHHYKRRVGATYEIDVTTFLNLMVVLVPFLLITAVFSRLTIVELNLPSAAGGAATTYFVGGGDDGPAVIDTDTQYKLEIGVQNPE